MCIDFFVKLYATILQIVIPGICWYVCVSWSDDAHTKESVIKG